MSQRISPKRAIEGPQSFIDWANAIVEGVERTNEYTSRFAQGNLLIPAVAVAWQVVSVHTNFVQALRVDWPTTSTVGTLTPISMPFALLDTITARAGITYTYSDYSVAQERVADDGTNTETQIIVPSYEVGDIVLAMPVRNGTGGSTGGAPIRWIDVSARAWAKKTGT